MSATAQAPNQLKASFQLARFVAMLAKAIKAAKADGKLNLLDLPHLLPVLPTILPAFDDINDIIGELTTLTADESGKFLELFAAEFDLDPLSTETEDLAKHALFGGAYIAQLIHYFGKSHLQNQ